MLAAAESYPSHRSHIGVVAAPGYRHVTATRHSVVGGVEALPAQHWTPHRNPRVGRLRASEIHVVAQVPADVARREPQGAQAGDHQVREILAHAVAGLENLIDGC